MSEKRAYQYEDKENVPIDETGTLAQLETRGRRQVSISVNATVNSDFALEAKFSPEGPWVSIESFSTVQSITETRQLSLEAVRLQNETAQEAGETADVKLGTS